jgi:hypothetical protein
MKAAPTMTRVFAALSLVGPLSALAVLAGLAAPGAALGAAPPRSAVGWVQGAPDTGFLDIGSDPPAKISIDDADTGKVTPQPRLELKVGHHRLTLVTVDGSHKRTIGFNIEAGQVTKLTLHLSS